MCVCNLALLSSQDTNVEGLLKEAQRKGYHAISFVDNNLSIYDRLENNGERYGYTGQIVPGITLTCSLSGGQIVELLIYAFDLTEFRIFYKRNQLEVRKARSKELQLLKQVLSKNKIAFSTKKHNNMFELWQDVVKCTRNHKYFRKKEAISDYLSFIYKELNNPKSNFFIERSMLYPSMDAMMKAINCLKSRGIVVISHAMPLSDIKYLINLYDFDGVECYHRLISKTESKKRVAFCYSQGLIVTGGDLNQKIDIPMFWNV